MQIIYQLPLIRRTDSVISSTFWYSALARPHVLLTGSRVRIIRSFPICWQSFNTFLDDFRRLCFWRLGPLWTKDDTVRTLAEDLKGPFYWVNCSYWIRAKRKRFTLWNLRSLTVATSFLSVSSAFLSSVVPCFHSLSALLVRFTCLSLFPPEPFNQYSYPKSECGYLYCG